MPSRRTRYRVVPGPLLVAVLAWSCAVSIVAAGTTVAADKESVFSLDNFTPVKSITVYFDDRQSTVSRGHRAQLQQLARDAQGVPGYMIEVSAYPSSDNQKLSMERASAVSGVLRQNGVPLAHLIVSAATNVPEQTAPSTASKGQSQNSRTVVTLLRNKSITQ
jgi:outer membrane protein OmpA-like peptidoglycan-associated protein